MGIVEKIRSLIGKKPKSKQAEDTQQKELSSEEEEKIKDRLRDLGYLS